jgi:PAS domain S-box-containing protein
VRCQSGWNTPRVSGYRAPTSSPRGEPAEDLLSEGRLLRAVLEAARESILVTEAELELPGPRIVYVNPAFTRITGYAPEDVLGKTPRILQGPKTDRAVLEHLRSSLGHDGTFEGETINYRKDGTEFLIQWYVVPLVDDEGRTTHYLAVQRDVTDERRLMAIAAGVNLAENLGYAIAGIRHELANPVNAIKLSLLLLERRIARGATAEEMAELTRRMLDDVERVEYLLGALKHYGAMERAVLEPVAVDAFVRRLADLVREELEVRAQSIELVLDAGAAEAMADPRALHQVLLNLVTNAADAVGARSTTRIVLRTEAVGSRVRITVEDDGPGMTAAELARLGQPFFTTKQRGTGLGLSIVRRLVSAMRGLLSIDSEAGHGTRVRVELERV